MSIAEQNPHGLFFIFVSREISARDYRRVIRSGSADWASLAGAPREISDIVFNKTLTPPETTSVKSRSSAPQLGL
jgi:hypothetical protein